jgi:hypothetical protein
MWNFLSRILGRGRPGPARPGSQGMAAPDIPPELLRLDEIEKLEAAVRHLMESDADKLTGRMFVLSLETIRGRYGNSWRYVAEKAQRTARNHIAQAVGPEDVVVPVGDVDFLVGLLGGSRREAPAKALRIDQGLSYAVTGEDLGMLGASAKQVEFAEDGKMSFRALSHLDLARAEQQQAVTIDLEAELADDEEEDDSFPSIEEVLEALVYRVQPIVQLVDQSTAFERLAAFSPPLGADSDENTITDNFPDPKVRAKIDLKCLKSARGHLRRLAAARKPNRRILVPVFFETLANNYTRGLFLKMAQKIPQPARKLLAFHVMGVPAGVAQSRLAELGAVVKPFSTGAFFGLPADFIGFEGLRELQPIGITAEDPRADGAWDLYAAAHGAGLATWVQDVAVPADRERGLGLGAVYGSGPLYPPEPVAVAGDDTED